MPVRGLDVEAVAEVDAAWRVCTQAAAKWGLHEQGDLEGRGQFAKNFRDKRPTTEKQ